MNTKRIYTFLFLFAVVLIACSGTRSTQVSTATSIPSQQRQPYTQPDKTEGWRYTNVPGTIDFTAMDPSVDPKKDFYQFANGTWLKKHPVPSTESSWGSFNELKENNDRVLRKICENASAAQNPKDSYLKLVGDYYYSAMDSAAREKAGITPLNNWLKKIDALKDKSELAALLGEFHTYGISGFFDMGVDQDLKDNTRMAIYASQGGLTLPSCDYYLKKDTSSANLRSAYTSHIEKMMAMLGYKPNEAKIAAKAIYALEYSLATGSKSPVDLRDPEANYNKMTWKEFTALSPSFAWDAYIKMFVTQAPADIIVAQPDFLKKMEEVISTTGMADIKHYLKWKLLLSASSYLTHSIEETNFTFFGTKLRGAKKMKPTWQRVISQVTFSSLAEALGHAFVDQQFDEEARKRVNEMVDNIFLVFKERLDTLEWMSEATRKQALHKLSTFVRKLGFPEKWESYEGLTLDRNSYLENNFRCNAFSTRKQMEKLSKPIDRTEWGMPPHMVNAYYNPIWNEIVFPAGIMQPPFFDVNREDAVNYARMGAVIGHELTHGFDDEGCQFDADGNLRNWWLDEDSIRFAERTTKLVNCFNSYEALPGVFVNGQLTLGENIADLGGLRISYYAYKRSLKNKKREKINGFTPEQRFFLAFAQIWKVNFTDNYLKVQIFTDPHSPGRYRVLGSLSNLEEFYENFGVKEGDAMYRSNEERAKIW